MSLVSQNPLIKSAVGSIPGIVTYSVKSKIITNSGPTAVSPSTVTLIGPVIAPLGTVTTSEFEVALRVGVSMPLKET